MEDSLFVWSEWDGQCSGLYFYGMTPLEARLAYCDKKGIHQGNQHRLKVCPALETIPF